MIKFKPYFYLCMVLVLLVVIGVTGASASTIDTNTQSTIRVTYDYQSQSLEAVDCHLYQVASLTEYGDYILSTAFSTYPNDFNSITSSTNWRTEAENVENFIALYSLSPDASLTTDSNGFATFESLVPGLYFLDVADHVVGNTLLTSQPMLITTPSYDASGAFDYYADYNPKVEESIYRIYEDITVEKIWVNDSTGVRPASIMANLYCDGALYDSVTLNSDNNWTYTWQDLDSSRTWAISEAIVPTNYTASYGTVADGFTITNTYRSPSSPNRPSTSIDPDDPDDSDDSDDPDTSTTTDVPDETDDTITPYTSTTPEDSTLPEDDTEFFIDIPDMEIPLAGTYMWLVYPLAGIGMICFLVGFFWIRKKET